MGIVYLIRNRENGMGYVGQTSSTLEKRWRQHKLPGSECRAISEAIRDHGTDAFECSVLEQVNDHVQLKEREAHWVEALGTLAPKGYNLMLGSVHSPASRRKASQSMRRALAEKGATGAPRGQSTLDAQDVRDIFRRFDIGETQKSVAQSYGVDKSTISHILRGTTWSHLGLKRKKPIVRALTALQLAAISKLYNQGLTYSQISKEVGRPLGTIKKALKRARRGGITTHKPVPQWWVQIKALYERGLTYAQVGEKLGKSEPAVAQAAKRLGVVSRPPGTRCK